MRFQPTSTDIERERESRDFQFQKFILILLFVGSVCFIQFCILDSGEREREREREIRIFDVKNVKNVKNEEIE